MQYVAECNSIVDDKRLGCLDGDKIPSFRRAGLIMECKLKLGLLLTLLLISQVQVENITSSYVTNLVSKNRRIQFVLHPTVLFLRASLFFLHPTLFFLHPTLFFLQPTEFRYKNPHNSSSKIPLNSSQGLATFVTKQDYFHILFMCFG